MRFDPRAYQRSLFFIQERERIRLARLEGVPHPWTKDPVLARYRFCNVRRMDDKVSQWLLKKWFLPYNDHRNMPLAATLARQLNAPAALEAIGFPETWVPARVEAILLERKRKKLKNYNGAYMTTGTLGYADKVLQTVRCVAQPVYNDIRDGVPIVDSTSMQKTWQNLQNRPGFGSFIAGQVTADLRWGLSGTWKDRLTWAPPGPGSMRGLNRIMNLPLQTMWNLADFTDALAGIISLWKSDLPETITSRLEAIDWQNCLCETDKYNRVLNNEGRPKSIYRPAEKGFF